MSESAGKRLSRARLDRGLTLDAAAHDTKMRPDKILALENDDLSRFGNNAYARGFLMLYARYLHVDVAEEIRALDVPHDLHVRDYQYLNNAPPLPEPERLSHFSQKAKTPSIWPLVVGVLLMMLVAFGFYVRATAQRLGLGAKPAAVEISPSRPIAPEAALAQVSTPAPIVPGENPMTVPEPAATLPEPRKTEPVAGAAGSAPEIRRAEPVTQVVPPGTVVNEVAIAAKKKTWVQVRKDEPNSRPIFVDYLYPNDPPLKLRGARFYVEAREPELIEIRKNGVPIPYQAGASIQ